MSYAVYAVTSDSPWRDIKCAALGISYYCTLYIDDRCYTNIVSVPVDWVPSVLWDRLSILGFRSYVQITTCPHNPFSLEA